MQLTILPDPLRTIASWRLQVSVLLSHCIAWLFIIEPSVTMVRLHPDLLDRGPAHLATKIHWRHRRLPPHPLHRAYSAHLLRPGSVPLELYK